MSMSMPREALMYPARRCGHTNTNTTIRSDQHKHIEMYVMESNENEDGRGAMRPPCLSSLRWPTRPALLDYSPILEDA